MLCFVAALSSALLGLVIAQGPYNYSANWPSLNSRPLPDWYDEAKFGIFIHMGVFSVPAFASISQPSEGAPTSAEWFWYNWETNQPDTVNYINENFAPGWTYQDFVSQYTLELWDPNAWASLFQQSGAKYVVFTSKHHEGFTNWPSNSSWGWNSVDTGPHRDVVGELSAAVKAQNLTMGLYHSLFEWYNPNFLQDQANNFNTDVFVVEKTLPELFDIVNRYEPDLIWSDGNWMAPSSYFHAPEFLQWLYNESPVRDSVVVNDRWGSETTCVDGGYYTCEDRYNPGKLQNYKWENCMTIDSQSWGFRRNAPLSMYLTISDLLSSLISTVACGGNLLLNVGPNHDGTIDVIFQERLLQLGVWLQTNGNAIYSSKPWRAQNETAINAWYTTNTNNNNVFLMFLTWPESGLLQLIEPVSNDQTVVSLLGYQGNLVWTASTPTGMEVTLPTLSPANTLAQASAWTLVLQNVQ